MNEIAFLTENEFAVKVGVSLSTIQQAMKAGRVPYVKLSARKRFIPENALAIMMGEAIEVRWRDMKSPQPLGRSG